MYSLNLGAFEADEWWVPSKASGTKKTSAQSLLMDAIYLGSDPGKSWCAQSTLTVWVWKSTFFSKEKLWWLWDHGDCQVSRAGDANAQLWTICPSYPKMPAHVYAYPPLSTVCACQSELVTVWFWPGKKYGWVTYIREYWILIKMQQEEERRVTKYEISHGKTVLTNARDWHSSTFQCMDDVKGCE